MNSLTSVWDRLISLFARTPDIGAGDEVQSEVSRVAGTIWNAILLGDLEHVKAMVENDPSVIEQRGAVGDLPIHMTFLYNTPKHHEIARWILDNYPHMITAQYLGSEYYGENILHIAIINQDFPTVRELVLRGEKDLLTARATGRFFQHGSACYYGETPLAFACCTNQPEIASFLLDHGADIHCTDSRGNTILHLLVIHNLPDMYTFVKNEYKRRYLNDSSNGGSDRAASPSPTPLSQPPKLDKDGKPDATPSVELWNRLNNDGLTPFCLAAKIDASEMFTFLLQETKLTQWTYGPVSCDLYPLEELDLAISPVKTVPPSCHPADNSSLSSSTAAAAAASHHSPPQSISRLGALELIMNEGNVNLLMHPRMIDLISQKWNKFAQRIFKQRFRTVLIYLCIFTLTTIVRQTVHHIRDKENARLANEHTGGGHESSDGSEYLPWAYFIYRYPFILWSMELFVLFGAWYKGSKEFSEMYRTGIREYFSSSGSALLENSLSCIFSACIFLVAILSLIGSPAQSAVLAMASIAGWSYLFFFLLAFRLTGPMVVMIHQMLTNDVLRFCLIYLVFLMGFAQAFFVLFESVGLSGFVVSIKVSGKMAVRNIDEQIRHALFLYVFSFYTVFFLLSSPLSSLFFMLDLFRCYVR